MDKPSFLVMDSGIGGLTVLKSLSPFFSVADFFYLSDAENAPYGEKSEEFLLARTTRLLKRYAAPFDGVIFACNTLSTTVIEKAEGVFDKRFFGVRPDEPKGKTLYLCTPQTACSRFMKNFAEKRGVTVFADGALAGAIEKDVFKILKGDFSSVSARLPESGVYDRIVLGCTHYIYIRPHIEKIFKADEIVDGRGALVASVCDFLKKSGVKLTTDKKSAELPLHRFLGKDIMRNYAVFCKIGAKI